MNISDNIGETALHYACYHSDISDQIIKDIIQKCSEDIINKKSYHLGHTPIMTAVYYNNQEAVTILSGLPKVVFDKEELIKVAR